MRNRELNHSASRTLAAVIGTVPCSLAVAVALALVLPLPPGHRVLVGAYSTFPVWVALTAWTFLAPDARRAWLRVIGVGCTAALAAAVATVLRGAPGAMP